MIAGLETCTDIPSVLDALHEKLKGSDEFHSPQVWRKLAAHAGVTGLDLPRAAGGADWSCRKMAELFAKCGYWSLDLRDVPGGGHARIASHDRRQFPILSTVADGNAYAAIAITEPGAGSDLHGMQMVALPEGDSYLLTGEKRFNARLDASSHVVLFAKVLRAGADPAITVFLLPLDMAGIEKRQLTAFGLNGVSFGGLELNQLRVPASMRVGGEGQGLSLFVEHFTYWRLAMSSAAIGCARSAVDQASSWMRTRNAFGGPIGRFTHLQQELATHVAKLHMAWLLIQSAMERIDNHLPAFADSAMAKAESLDAAVNAVQWAIRVHGARGVTTDFDLEKRLRDVLSLSIADGTSDVLRGQVARAVIGNDLYERSLGRENISTKLATETSRRFW